MRFRWTQATCILVLSIPVPVSRATAETLLVANKTDDTVDLIDLQSGASTVTLPTGHAPHEIAVSPDGSLAVITNYGDRDLPGNSLTVVDVVQGAVLRTIDLAGHTRPHGVVFVSETTVAVTTEGSAHLVVVDVHTGRVLQAVPTEQEVSHMVAATRDGSRAFVANIGSGTVTAIDLAKGKKLSDIQTGDGAEGIAITPDGKEVWVSNRGADTLSIIDRETLEIIDTIDCPGFPIRIAFTTDGSRGLVSAARSGEVVVFDTRGRKELNRTGLDLSNAPDAARRLFGDRFGDSPVPVGLVISPDNGTAWVAATQADAVVVVEPGSLLVRDLLKAGREPDGMAFSPATVLTQASSRP